MLRDAKPHDDSGRGRQRRKGLIVSVLIAVGLLAAACSSTPTGPGVAGAGSSSSNPDQSSPSASPGTGALAYSLCMRDHGISDFPDPKANGDIGLNAEPGSDLDPNNPQFQAAQDACKSLLPAARAAGQHPSLDEALRYSKCMRDHGISDFPDPDANGHLEIPVGPGSDLRPDSPQFQTADVACGGTFARKQSGEGAP